MTNQKIKANKELSTFIKELCEENRDIILVSLCTTDGFPITCFSINELSNQSDKFAAMSSTLSSLSDSSVKQVNKGKCEITIVEATSGNLLFVRANYLSAECVLTVVAKEKMALATARYKTKKLAEAISNISE